MYQNKKFRKAAIRRKYLAILATLVLHLAVFSMLTSSTDLKELLPGFIKELMVKEPESSQTTPVP